MRQYYHNNFVFTIFIYQYNNKRKTKPIKINGCSSLSINIIQCNNLLQFKIVIAHSRFNKYIILSNNPSITIVVVLYMYNINI